MNKLVQKVSIRYSMPVALIIMWAYEYDETPIHSDNISQLTYLCCHYGDTTTIVEDYCIDVLAGRTHVGGMYE